MRFVSCRVGDEIRVGDDVRIEVLEIDAEGLRLGVTSPEQIPRYREFWVAFGDDEGGGGAESYGDRELIGV